MNRLTQLAVVTGLAAAFACPLSLALYAGQEQHQCPEPHVMAKIINCLNVPGRTDTEARRCMGDWDAEHLGVCAVLMSARSDQPNWQRDVHSSSHQKVR
jgi:hypothetical protein